MLIVVAAIAAWAAFAFARDIRDQLRFTPDDNQRRKLIKERLGAIVAAVLILAVCLAVIFSVPVLPATMFIAGVFVAGLIANTVLDLYGMRPSEIASDDWEDLD